MSKPRLQGKNALVMGNAFDLRKTMDVLHRLVCTYMDASGAAEATVSPKHKQYPAAKLPRPGIEVAETVWRRMQTEYDVVDEPLLYKVGEVTFKAFLLGKTFCHYLQETGDIVTSRGQPIDQLDNRPVISIYGATNDDGSHALLTPEQMDKVEEVLESLGLDRYLHRANLDQDGVLPVHMPSQLGTLTLPYELYGAGRKELVCRCVMPGGKEITAKVKSRVN